MQILIGIALVIGIATASSVCLADDGWDVMHECGVAAGYLPTTCDCLAHKVPHNHLFGGMGPDACTFRDPPAWFDPSHAPPSVLESWGITPRDAKTLGDPHTRMIYYRVIRRFYGGVGCTRDKCGPGLSEQARADQCKVPGQFLSLCIRQGGGLTRPNFLRHAASTPTTKATGQQ